MITKNDIFIKARILSEGVRFETKEPLSQSHSFDTIELDKSGLPVQCMMNPYSRLRVVFEGDRASIYDEAALLETAHLIKRPAWRNIKLSNGQAIDNFLTYFTVKLMNVVIHYYCDNCHRGEGCAYCGFYTHNPTDMENMAPETFRELAVCNAEIIKIATDAGWRGTVALNGGAFPNDKWHTLTDRLATFITPIREALSPEVFSQLHVVANVYPPEDFSELLKWKNLGFHGTQFDLETADAKYFAAICPGKTRFRPHEFWKEAQIASRDIFGPGRGTVSFLLMGLEPMETLLEGLEERLSKGIAPVPITRVQLTGSKMERFPPPEADWLVEACEKMAELYIRYADRTDGALVSDMRPGLTQAKSPWNLALVNEEIMRRQQPQGQTDEPTLMNSMLQFGRGAQWTTKEPPRQTEPVWKGDAEKILDLLVQSSPLGFRPRVRDKLVRAIMEHAANNTIDEQLVIQAARIVTPKPFLAIAMRKVKPYLKSDKK
jgi:bacteriochlorophyllide c C-7(1)-hydroxylase